MRCLLCQEFHATIDCPTLARRSARRRVAEAVGAVIFAVAFAIGAALFGVALSSAHAQGAPAPVVATPTTVIPGVGVVVDNNPVTPPDKVPKVWGTDPRPADTPPLQQQLSQGCPSSGLVYESHTVLYPDGSSAEENQAIFCGSNESGYCWAPPKETTYSGEAVQTGLDYTKAVCVGGHRAPQTTATSIPSNCWAPPVEQMYPGEPVSGYDLTKEQCT